MNKAKSLVHLPLANVFYSLSLSFSLPQPKEPLFKPHPEGSNLEWLKAQGASVSRTIFLFGETLMTFMSAG